MKVLITTHYYSSAVNGVVTSVLNLKNELENNGHDVKVLTLSPSMHSYKEGNVYYIASFDVSWFYPNTRMKLHLSRKILSELIEWHPDVIHSQCEFGTYAYAKRISSVCNVPIIHTYHTVYEDYTHYFCPSKKLGRKLVSDFSRHVLNRTDCVIAPTGKVADILRKYNIHTPVEVVPTGIDVSKYGSKPSDKEIRELKDIYGISENDFTLLFIGRLAKEKNVEEILDILKNIDSVPVKLLIVGDGPHRAALEQLCNCPQLKDKVIFTGMIAPEKVSTYYHMGDLFVNASTSETQGLTYIEAMAAGLPMLCRKDRCLDGVITDGCNGWQYTSPEDFIEKLNALCFDANKRREMAEASLLTVQSFSTQTFVNHVEEIYLKAISEHHSGSCITAPTCA